MAVVIMRNPTFLEEIDALADVAQFFDYTQLHAPIDAFQEKDEFVVRLELPGVKKEDVDVSVDGETLNIKAEKKAQDVSEDAAYYDCERWYGKYSRSVELPFTVDAEKVSTHFEDGVLEIRLPRSEESKPHHISIAGAEPTTEAALRTETEPLDTTMEECGCIM